MLYDLHTHSSCSDGQMSPTELVNLAKQQGVDVLALTDHDTVSGISEAQQAAGSVLTVIPGVEFSSLWRGLNIHIVGLNVDIDSPVLRSAVESQCDTRQQRAQTIAERLEKCGIKGALGGAQHYAQGDSIGRPHFAKYLVDSEYVDSFAKAFKLYLGAGKAGDVKHLWPNISTVVNWIKVAGGMAVLAHPNKYDLTQTKLYALLDSFVEAGGEAMEVVTGQQEAFVSQKLSRVAQEHNLLASCGSDFHSLGQPWQMLGRMSALPIGCSPVWQSW